MLPAVQALFTLVRELASGASVTEIAASKWLVQRHGLAPLAARAGATQFRDDLARSALAWTRITTMVEPLVAGLVAAGARVAPIKGLAYAKILYAHPDERPMSDVDVLVRAADVGIANRELERMGFVRVADTVLHHATAWQRDDMIVDLHVSIVALGRSGIDLDAVWERATPGWPAGAEQLEPVDALVFQLVHMIRQRLRVPLIQVVDAIRLLARGDRSVAIARARAWNLGTAIEIALRFCDDVIAGNATRLGGWLGPERGELAFFYEPSFVRKVAFDVATAGSISQLVARGVGFGANRLQMWSRRARK